VSRAARPHRIEIRLSEEEYRLLLRSALDTHPTASGCNLARMIREAAVSVANLRDKIHQRRAE